MECHSIEKKLSAYMENELSSDEKIQIDEHLKTCPKCSLSLEELKKTVVYTQKLEDKEPPPWLTQKVMARVRKEAGQKKGILRKLFFPLYIKVPIEVFATVAIAVTAFYVFKTIEPGMRVTKTKAPSEQVIVSEGEEKSRSRQDKLSDHDKSFPRATAPARKQGLKREPGVPAEEAEKQDAPAAPAGEETFSQELFRASDIEVKEQKRALKPALRGTGEVEEKGIILTVHVEEIDRASKDIQIAINQLRGKIIKIESFDDKDVLTAGLNAQKMREFNEKLRSLGEVEEKEGFLDTLKGDIEIRIEILRISKQLP